MKSLLLFLFTFITVLTINAQDSFHGTLVNYKGKPIKNAKIYVHDPDKYVKSNKSGVFKIDDIEADDTIHIKYLGYIHDIPVDGSAGMFIKINKEPVKGEYIDIGAGMVDLASYNGPIAIRTSKELEAMGTSNLAEAMVGMKGVRVTFPKTVGNNDGVSVSLRGGKPLWVLDGVKMEDYPYISVMEVEKIVVLHDGGMLGLGGYGGVIIVTTKGSNL